MTALDDTALDRLFRTARSRNGWRDQPVSDADIRSIYELCKWGPTSANSTPGRFIWVRSPEAKATLAACASGANPAKILAAPVTVIIARAVNFHELLPELFPHAPIMYQMMQDNPSLRSATARRNATLQGAYLIIAARALGFDCGPLSGFDEARVNAAFFPDKELEVDFLCSIGQGSDENLFDRLPRLPFERANQIL